MQSNKILFILIVLTLFACKKEEVTKIDNIPCLPAQLQNGVIAYYPFSVNSLSDFSGNQNALSNPTSAAPTTDRNGNTDCAYQFLNNQNTQDYLTTTSTNFLDGLESFTISLWYMPEDNSRAPGVYETLVNRGSGLNCPNRQGQWSLGLYDCRRAVFGHNNSVWANRIASSGGCQGEIDALTDKWHHVAAVKEGNSFKLYFNGNLDDSKNDNANCGNAFEPAQDLGDFFVGLGFTGKIDDIIIYNKALNAQEINLLYNTETCCE